MTYELPFNCHFTAFGCQVLQHSEVPITGASLPLVAVLVPQGGTMKWSMIALGRFVNAWYFFLGSCLVLWVAISKQNISHIGD